MNKINYNLMMKEQLSNLTGKPKLLLHVCCAPCTSGVLPVLKNFFDITLFYYNPNIYTKDEYLLRAEQFAKLTNLPIIISEYNHDEFLNVAKNLEKEVEGGKRCNECIKLRLEKSFEYAVANKFDYISSTLSISPHKDANFINECGNNLSQTYPIKYLYADFKKENGYLNSVNISKELNLYRQIFCGCEFSKIN